MSRIKSLLIALVISLAVLAGCSFDDQAPGKAALTPTNDSPARAVANVAGVGVSGSPGAYQFSVEISSPDLDCEQYADWWEVLSESGDLIYRRVLLHSHANEQPFTRSGGPVPIAADQEVWIRAHFHPTGYGGIAYKGSVQEGFQAAELSSEFAAELSKIPPLPGNCDF